MASRGAIVAMLIVVAFGCEAPRQTEAPQETAVPEAQGPPEWETEIAEMVRVLELTIAEEDAVRAAYPEREDEVRTFLQSARGQGLMEDEAALADAARARDLSEVRAITTRAGEDRNALREIIADGDRNIRESLPTEKRVAWDAYQISSELLELMQPLGLTLDQASQIETQAVTSFEAAMARNEPNPHAAAFLSLERWSEAAVLTPAQRQEYETIKKENPLRSLRF